VSLLEYESTGGLERRSRRRWIISAVLGLSIGLVGGCLGYRPMMEVGIGYGPIVAMPAIQPMLAWALFSAVASICGLSVAFSGLVVTGRRRMWFGWPILFTIVFFLGLCIGLLTVRSAFDQFLATGNASPYSILPTRGQWAGIHALTGPYALVRISNTLMLAPLICGCAAVLVVLALIKTLQFVGQKARRESRV
jgi:hypothetical protein